MNEFIDNIRASLNAPWALILACPIGIVCALHFSSQPRGTMYGSDTSASLMASVIEDKSITGWLRRFLSYFSAIVAATSFYALMNPIGAQDMIDVALKQLAFLSR
jgi:hypothetical protein